MPSLRHTREEGPRERIIPPPRAVMRRVTLRGARTGFPRARARAEEKKEKKRSRGVAATGAFIGAAISDGDDHASTTLLPSRGARASRAHGTLSIAMY